MRPRNRLSVMQEPKHPGGLTTKSNGTVICLLCRKDFPREKIRMANRRRERTQLCHECHQDNEARISGHIARIRQELRNHED